MNRKPWLLTVLVAIAVVIVSSILGQTSIAQSPT